MAKDPLDALLGDEPTDIDDEDLLLELEGNDKGDDDPLTSEKVKELEAQLADLEKEKQGFLSGIKDERRKRQEMKGQLDQMTDTINGILTTRNQAPAEPEPADPNKLPGARIEFTEDGDAYVPNDKFDELEQKYLAKIEELEERLELTSAATEADAAAQQIINSIVGEDERFSAAYAKYQSARNWVNNQVIDFQRRNNIQGQLSSGQALDHVFSDGLRQEFSDKFGGLDLVDVTTAEDSQHHFRTMLKHTADTMAPAEPDSRFNQVLNKPSGLGKSANAKAGEIPLSEKVGNLSAQDIMNLSDDQIEALERAMAREEQTDGVKW